MKGAYDYDMSIDSDGQFFKLMSRALLGTQASLTNSKINCHEKIQQWRPSIKKQMNPYKLTLPIVQLYQTT